VLPASAESDPSARRCLFLAQGFAYHIRKLMVMARITSSKGMSSLGIYGRRRIDDPAALQRQVEHLALPLSPTLPQQGSMASIATHEAGS
jgi:hypothetical protein